MYHFPFNVGLLKWRSALYLRDNGSIADLTPFWVVTLYVCSAFFLPIYYWSAIVSADTTGWRSLDAKVFAVGTSFVSAPACWYGVSDIFI